MKNLLLFLIILGTILGLVFPIRTSLALSKKTLTPTPQVTITPEPLASESAAASQSSKFIPPQPKKSDITQPTKPKNKLERALLARPINHPSWNNFITYIVQQSVQHGLPVNTIVLILLLPLAASLIAILRHIVGLKGLGIFTPTVLSVAFLSAGVEVGLIIFFTIVITLTLVRLTLKKLHFRIQYLPRMALIMVFISLSMIGLFYFLVRYTTLDVYTLSIFPIIIMILLAESFMEIQIGRSLREAIYFTLQTLLISLLVYLVLTSDWVQVIMITHIELTTLLIILIDIFVGKYVGLRILEYWRFRRLVSSR